MTEGRILIDQEVGFNINELFFSRTDERGIILAGNSVFQRISLYSWEEILKKPHNIIRHPDMPKGVFYLLWDTIKQSLPIGAYVKNRAKDGRYYWVFAIVTPIEGGYLSVRLKPTSEIFNTVIEAYKNFLLYEQSGKISNKDSLAHIANSLSNLGFLDYFDFMSTALATEISCRNKALSAVEDHEITEYISIKNSAKKLIELANQIFEVYQKTIFVPLNIKVQSAHMQEKGASIKIISDNYSALSIEIEQSMSTFVSSAKEVFAKVNNGMFMTCTAKIQKEIINDFKKESSDNESEVNFLETQCQVYKERSINSLKEILKQIEVFVASCKNMRRLALALEVTRIMGKIEVSRIDEVNSNLSALIIELEEFQALILNGLKEIDLANRIISKNAESLLNCA